MKEVIWLNNIAAEDNEGNSLKDYNLTIFEGEVVCIYGYHGSGKRILQGTILGEIPITSGNIYINETKVNNYNSDMAQKKGIIIIDARKRLIPELSIEENLFAIKNKKNIFSTFNLKAAKMQMIKHLEQIDMVSIKDKRVGELTTFEEQMICIAKALANRVQLIILNCTKHLYGENEMKKLTAIIRKLTKDGVSFLILCDKINSLMAVSDKIQYIQDGTDRFIYNYDHLSIPQSTYENIEKGIQTVKSNSKSIIGFTEFVWNSSFEFTNYWDIMKNQNEYYNFGDLEMGKNAFFIPENSALSLIPSLNISNNVCVCIYPRISNGGIINRSLMEFVMKEFYLTTGISSEIKLPDELSYFEKKIVSIYRYELLHPRYMLFENPFFGLDEISCDLLRNYFAHLVNMNIKIIIFSNSYQELKKTCDEIIITENGKLLRTKKDTLS